MFTDIEGSTRLLHRLGDTYPDCADRPPHASSAPASPPTTASRSSPRATRSSWPSPLPARRCPRPSKPSAVCTRTPGRMASRSRSAWVCTPASRSWSTGRRTVWTCTARHGSRRPATEARSSCRLGLLDLVSDSLPDGVRVRDLGDHWLKDLPAPEHLLQLDVAGLPDTFPPLKSLEPPTNVPRDATALVGRRRERRELREQLTTGDARLVTLTGPGGAGKTRLGAAVALDVLPEHPQGVWFVDLSRVTEAGRSCRRSRACWACRWTATSRPRRQSSATSATARCCWCSTTWSRWWTRRRRWGAFSHAVRGCGCLAPAASCWVCATNGSTRCPP